ncbi:hypothetical protein [Nocardioides sp. Iso805N]|uniref:hypothetical protein n=1 Tax=Nocardioides sp. Iso805N TaxID=1283287 RepID=UPI0003A77E3D|nr:hypothetical protein [Nocardioides sp. Iso805N]
MVVFVQRLLISKWTPMAVVGSTHGDLSHAERLDATRSLLDLAAATLDPDLRRTVLGEVAALNAEDALAIVTALHRHQHPQAADDPALLTFALEAYVDAVLALDPCPELDVLPRVMPALREAVIQFNRDLVARHDAPGVGGRSGLR